MKLAALTIYERCLIQMHIAHEAGLLENITQGARPRWHAFRTFETQLPLRFVRDSSGEIQGQDSLTAVVKGRVPKPPLICSICTRIKAFSSIIHFWSHLVHSHQGEHNVQTKLKEIRRSAELWAIYWTATGYFTAEKPTTRKIQQILSGSITWSDVLAWEL